MAQDNKNLRCHNCKHWWPTAEATGGEPSCERSIFGQCRRHAPPTAFAELPDHSRVYPFFATIKRDEWCGEHAHKEM